MGQKAAGKIQTTISKVNTNETVLVEYAKERVEKY